MSKEMWYKGVRIAKGTALYAALEKDDPVSKKLAEKLAKELDAQFKKDYPMCTKEWFERMNAK